MTILGVDPGSTRIGVGIIKKRQQKFQPLHYGLLVPEKELIPLDLPKRLLAIYNMTKQLIEHYKPDVVGIETLIFGRNVSTALPVAHARAMILLVAASQEIPILEFAPTKIKRGVTSTGSADKKQVAFMVKTLLSIPKEEKILDDVTDALAIAITTANHWQSPIVQRSTTSR